MFWPRTPSIGAPAMARSRPRCRPSFAQRRSMIIASAALRPSPVPRGQALLRLLFVLGLLLLPGAAALAQQRPGGLVAQQRPGAAPPARGGPLEADIPQVPLQPIPIAIPPFLGEDPQFPQDVTAVVAADLERSGLFQPLDPASFIDRPRDLNQPPRFSEWRV